MSICWNCLIQSQNSILFGVNYGRGVLGSCFPVETPTVGSEWSSKIENGPKKTVTLSYFWRRRWKRWHWVIQVLPSVETGALHWAIGTFWSATTATSTPFGSFSIYGVIYRPSEKETAIQIVWGNVLGCTSGMTLKVPVILTSHSGILQNVTTNHRPLDSLLGNANVVDRQWRLWCWS